MNESEKIKGYVFESRRKTWDEDLFFRHHRSHFALKTMFGQPFSEES